ncbi:MAG: CotH kinase family protein, partial [Deltaproteobacteria bacterium]|nr:CotH kinase family protein [Deltaproteobacteria bacterium]
LRAEFGRRDGADQGNLYDCVPPFCAMFPRGTEKDDYVLPDCGGGEPCGWVLETNALDPSLNTYGDLIGFITWLSTCSDEELEAELEARFEVDAYLRFLAVAAAIGDYDGHLDGDEDYLLYHRPDTDRWVLIPKDHDRSYGAKRCKGSLEATGGPVLPPWCGPAAPPLGQRILAVEGWREAYLGYLGEVAGDWLTVEVHAAWIDELEALLEEPFAADATFPFDAAAHAAALGGGPWEDDPPGLLAFVAARRARLLEEVSR